MTPLQDALAVSFWVCAACVAYAYLGYPLLIWLLAHIFGQRPRVPEAAGAELPTVSLLVVAYNEETVIEKRILSALATDYPCDRFEIIIASDGSTDATNEIIRRYADRGVRLLDFKQWRGKASALNDAFAEVTGEIVLLSDANTQLEPSAVPRLVRWFTDPAIGVVCGRLVLTDPETGKNVDSLYWKYETFLKKCEDRLGGLLGANGAIYAIRRDLFAPIPGETSAVDDLVLPLQTKLRTGCRIVYDCEAVAHEETAKGIRAEFHRRSRIGAGGFQSIVWLWRLLNPNQGWTAFTFFSHKVLRWLCPFFLLGMLASNLCLLDRPLYQAALLAQAGFYLMSLLLVFVPVGSRLLKPLRLTTMFTSMNAALLVGFWRWLRGSQRPTWVPTVRAAGPGRVP